MGKVKSRIILLLCLSVFLAWGATAHATPIAGDIAFGSFGQYDLTGGTDLATNTGFDFINANNAVVSAASGDFATFAPPAVTYVQFYDFSFAPITPGTVLWSFSDGMNTYSLTMQSGSIEAGRTATNVTIKGTAIISGLPGFESTEGTFIFQASNSGSSFSFDSNAKTVPEPATLLLLGTGLVGAALYRRRRA